jgi:hypothetical protein
MHFHVGHQQIMQCHFLLLRFLYTVLESGQIPILPIDEEDGLELCPLLASIWTHCSVTATKAGRNRDKRQKIREFCIAMKPFIE